MVAGRKPQTPEGTAASVIPLDADAQDRQLAVRAAWMYFMEGQTQEQVARHLGMNRIRVNRILAAARETGLVQIRITSPLVPCIELENRLRDAYGLREAVVVPTPVDPENVRRMVAVEGGRLLSGKLHEGIRVAIGWGRTLRLSLQAMERRPVPGMEVVSLTGGLTHGSVINSYEAGLRLADMFGATCSYIAGPAFTDTEEMRDTLMSQSMVVDAFDHARKADIAYLSVGGLDMQASMAQLGLIGPGDIETLRRAGAIGDLLSYWIDERGNIVDHPLNRRVLSLPPDDLAKLPEVMLVTAGKGRAAAIRAVLRKGLVSSLVTDEQTAVLVLAPDAAGKRLK